MPEITVHHVSSLLTQTSTDLYKCSGSNFVNLQDLVLRYLFKTLSPTLSPKKLNSCPVQLNYIHYKVLHSGWRERESRVGLGLVFVSKLILFVDSRFEHQQFEDATGFILYRL